MSRPRARSREHPALGHWLRQTPSGRLVLDRAKITAEARLDGKYLLFISGPDLSAEDVALATRTYSGPNAGPRPEVHHRAAAGVPPARTPHPRARAAVLVGAAADPGRRTPHRTDLAADRPRARPVGCSRERARGLDVRGLLPGVRVRGARLGVTTSLHSGADRRFATVSSTQRFSKVVKGPRTPP
jgi:hypothetical protein